MQQKIALTAFVTLLASSLCAIVDSSKEPHDLSLKLSIPNEKYTLDNGLTVILAEDHTTPFVASSVWYQVGSVSEQPQKTGLAHLFEHLMFEGSRQVKASGHFKYLENAGAFDVNATTSFDRTNYYQTVPKNQLELVLSLESSRMYFLELTQKKLDEQRAVVRREREQRFETTPYGLAALTLWQSIFPKGHPYYGRVIGSHEDLEAASLGDVQGFYDEFYGPSNACLTLVGDFDSNQAKSLINKYFATLPKTKIEITPKLPAVVIDQQEIIRVDEKLGKVPLLRIQYLSPALFKSGDAEMDVLAHILTGGEYGRLTKALTRDQRLASSVSAYQQSLEQLSTFTIDARLNPGVDDNEVIKTIDKVLAELITNPPTALEIDRARNSILTDQFFGLQNLGGYSGRAELLQSYNRFAKNPDFIQQDVMRFRRIDSKALVLAAQHFLKIQQARKILIAKPASNHVAKKGN